MTSLSAATDRSPQRWGGISPWVVAIRPKTLAAAIAPVAVGTAAAAAMHGADIGVALVALLAAMSIQVGTNLANDVFDFEKGADTEQRLGPARVVQLGLLTPRQVKRGMWLSFLVASALGLVLFFKSGPMVLVIGVFSIASGISYTAGPYPLAYLGLGDLFVFIFFGLVAVIGTAFVQLGYVPALAIWSALPVGALATVLIAINNLRDRRTDEQAGKRTMAVRFGSRFTVVEIRFLLMFAYLTPILLVLAEVAGPFVLLLLVTSPVAVRVWRDVARSSGVELNPVLGRAARLLLIYGLTFALGLSA